MISLHGPPNWLVNIIRLIFVYRILVSTPSSSSHNLSWQHLEKHSPSRRAFGSPRSAVPRWNAALPRWPDARGRRRRRPSPWSDHVPAPWSLQPRPRRAGRRHWSAPPSRPLRPNARRRRRGRAMSAPDLRWIYLSRHGHRWRPASRRKRPWSRSAADHRRSHHFQWPRVIFSDFGWHSINSTICKRFRNYSHSWSGSRDLIFRPQQVERVNVSFDHEKSFSLDTMVEIVMLYKPCIRFPIYV